MKVKVCDVCKKDNVLTIANRRMTHYNIDKHKGFVKGMTFDEAKKKVGKLLGYADMETM